MNTKNIKIKLSNKNIKIEISNLNIKSHSKYSTVHIGFRFILCKFLSTQEINSSIEDYNE